MWIVQDDGNKDVNSREGVIGKATFAKLHHMIVRKNWKEAAQM